jgi:anionic cell wall polymer biosynthesis LytR-Cps2A-Psr (LCP) family protein
VQVSFGGLINATEALGGVYLNFPYPAKDAYSGLNIKHTGCQLVDGFQALAVARSRHYQYFQNGQWYYDGTSDYGRIDRQDTFVRALIKSAKGKYNPLTLNSFLSDLPQGITLDSEWSLNELIGLVLKFHGINPADLATYTLPTVSAGNIAPYGDVLVEQQPEGQQLLVKIFGSQLIAPTNPAPNAQLQSLAPPKVSVTTTTIASTKTTTKSTVKTTTKATTKTTTKAPTTTTTVPGDQVPYFDPTNCQPK